MNRIPQLYLDIIALAGHPYIRLSQFTKKEQRMSSLLSQSQTQCVVLTALLECFLYVSGNTVKSVRRTGTVYTLMGTLMIIVGNPVVESLAGIGKGGKKSI